AKGGRAGGRHRAVRYRRLRPGLGADRGPARLRALPPADVLGPAGRARRGRRRRPPAPSGRGGRPGRARGRRPGLRLGREPDPVSLVLEHRSSIWTHGTYVVAWGRRAAVPGCRVASALHAAPDT